MKTYFKLFFILFVWSNFSLAITCEDIFNKIPTELTKELSQTLAKKPASKLSNTAFLKKKYSILKELSKKDLLKKAETYTPDQIYVLGKFFFEEGIKNKNTDDLKLNKYFFNQGNVGKAFALFKQGNHQDLGMVRLKLGEIVKTQLQDISVKFKTLYFNDLNKKELIQLAKSNTPNQNYSLGQRFYLTAKKTDQALIFLNPAAEQGQLYAIDTLVGFYKEGTESMGPNLEAFYAWKQKFNKISKRTSPHNLKEFSHHRVFNMEKYELQISKDEIIEARAVRAFRKQENNSKP